MDYWAHLRSYSQKELRKLDQKEELEDSLPSGTTYQVFGIKSLPKLGLKRLKKRKLPLENRALNEPTSSVPLQQPTVMSSRTNHNFLWPFKSKEDGIGSYVSKASF